MIELRAIRKTLREADGQARTLFDGLDLSVGEEERSVAIMGRSGSGKSTLLRMLAGLDLDYSGDYRFHGEELTRTPDAMADFRLRNIGIVTQHYDLLSDRNVLQNVVFGAPDRRGAAVRAQRCLTQVHLDGFARKKVTRISGGEAQRVAIARALVKQPAVILADEPTGALDEGTEDRVLALFEELQHLGTRFVIATHSSRVAAACDRVLTISGHRLTRTADTG